MRVIGFVLLFSAALTAQAKEPASLTELRGALSVVNARLLATEDGKLYLQLQRAIEARVAELKAEQAAAPKPAATPAPEVKK